MFYGIIKIIYPIGFGRRPNGSSTWGHFYRGGNIFCSSVPVLFEKCGLSICSWRFTVQLDWVPRLLHSIKITCLRIQSCGGVAFYTGSAVEYTGIAKRFQEQLFFNTSNVIFPTFIALFASSACFFLLVIVHLGFLIAAPFGYEEKEQPRATDEENPAQSTEAIEKPEAAGNEGEQAETEVDKAIGDKQESAGPGPAAAAQGGQDGPQSGPEDEANETGTDQSRAKDVAPASKETEEKVGNEGGGDTEEGATNRKDSEADTIHSMSDA